MISNAEGFVGSKEAAKLTAESLGARVIFIGVNSQPEVFSPRKKIDQTLKPEPHSYTGFHLRAALRSLIQGLGR